jgi:hypothetical protein
VRFLLRTLGSEPWWSLLFFVGVFCHPFYWGFYAYLVATPIGVLTLAAAIRVRNEPTTFWRIAVVGLSLCLLLSHVVVFLVVLGLFGAFLLADWTPGRPPRELALWLPAGVGFASWFLFFALKQPVREGRWVWDLGPHRLLQIASGFAGDAHDTRIGWFVYGGLLLLALVAGFKLRFRRGPLALFGSALLLSLFSPAVAGGISHLSWRLSFWAFLGFFALVRPMESARRVWIARATTVVVLCLALGWIGTGHYRFNRKASTFDPVLAAMASGKTLQPLIFDYHADAGPSAPYLHSYLHFGGWYFVEKHGLYAGMFRFAPRQLPIIRTSPLFGNDWKEDGAYWSNEWFDLDTAGEYDYYLLRKVKEHDARTFLEDNPALEEIARSGPLHLLHRVARDPDRSVATQ